jgi:septum formation protein
MPRLSASPVVLASASAARAALLERAGLAVLREPAGIDESAIKAAFRGEGRDAGQCAAALAEAKALRVSARRPGALVIAGDQLLVRDERWFDKPASRAEAREHLLALRGRRHELVTAACVARDGALLWHIVERPFLFMREFSDAFLDAYLAALGDDVLSTVGAYRLEGPGAQLFARLEGDYFSVLGLPLLPLLEFLRGHGVVMP